MSPHIEPSLPEGISLPVGMIWAEARSRVIGRDGGMPWHLPEDLAYLKELTRDCPVVMGRKTWYSLPERFRPLPGRVNMVITSDEQCAADLQAAGAETAPNLIDAVDRAQAAAGQAAHTVWILGGGTVYAEALKRGLAQLVSVTRIDLDIDGDTLAPTLDPQRWELDRAVPEQGWRTAENGTGHRFETYRRRTDGTPPGSGTEPHARAARLSRTTEQHP